MPFKTIPVDLSAAGRTVLVPNGNIITGFAVLPQRAGLPFTFALDMGNGQQLGPIVAPLSVDVSPDTPIEDVSEGLQLINTTAQAGVIADVFVSYLRGRSRGTGVTVNMGA